MYTLHNITKHSHTMVEKDFRTMDMTGISLDHLTLIGETSNGNSIMWTKNDPNAENNKCILLCKGCHCKGSTEVDPNNLDREDIYVCNDCKNIYCVYCEEYFSGEFNSYEEDNLHCPTCVAENAYENWVASVDGMIHQYSNC